MGLSASEKRIIQSILMNRQNKLCAYCKNPMNWDDNSKRRITIDHVIPLSRGGKNCISNMKAACSSCNSEKGNRSEKEFMKFSVSLSQVPMDVEFKFEYESKIKLSDKLSSMRKTLKGLKKKIAKLQKTDDFQSLELARSLSNSANELEKQIQALS